MDQPFQNWTRADATLIGVVMLFLSITRSAFPTCALRRNASFERHPVGPRRVFALQVTDLRETVTEVRILASARQRADVPSICVARSESTCWPICRRTSPMPCPATGAASRGRPPRSFRRSGRQGDHRGQGLVRRLSPWHAFRSSVAGIVTSLSIGFRHRKGRQTLLGLDGQLIARVLRRVARDPRVLRIVARIT